MIVCFLRKSLTWKPWKLEQKQTILTCWRYLLAVICTESKNILIRHFYKHADEKVPVRLVLFGWFAHFYMNIIYILKWFLPSFFLMQLRPKRAASENLAPENGAKHPRSSSSATLPPWTIACSSILILLIKFPSPKKKKKLNLVNKVGCCTYF